MLAWDNFMIRILFFFIIFFKATESIASSALTLPEPPILESSPKSKEIRKTIKLLENSQERDKLLKTLKVLASAQEEEEKKKSDSLVSYITPVTQFIVNSVLGFFASFKKIPQITEGLVESMKVEKNREDLWSSLMYFPLLVIIGALLEGGLTLFFRRRLERRKQNISKGDFAEKKRTYAYMTLFYPFLYSLLFLPFFVTSLPVRNWLIGFWFLLFAIRVLLLQRKLSSLFMLSDDQPAQEVTPKGWPFLKVLGGVAIWIFLFSGLNVLLNTKSYGEEFVLNLILLMSFPLLILYFREWRHKEMPKYLEDSTSLSTVPPTIGFLVNIFIRYLPWLFLLVSIPLVIDKVLLEGGFWETFGVESFGSIVALMIFLSGRRRIDAFATYKMPKMPTAKIQAFTSYISPMRQPIARIVQSVWYVSFFAFIMAIWNNFVSDLFINIVSHPMTKTSMTIMVIWGAIYVLKLGLDFFVQLHVTPQTVRGKRKEPTAFAKTFGPMLHSVAKWIMGLVGIFLTLESLGFDLKILVYLMSAIAFAVSLGAQSLVKDIINGFFALIDGSFAVGDVVTVGTHTGSVESLSLRALTLRHKDGSLQTIPFSEVGNIINRSRDYTLVPIDIATSYKTSIGSVYEALTKTIDEMAQDPIYGKMILEPLSFSGIDRFVENAVHVSASIKIKPDPYNYFGRELNRRFKIHMDLLGIAPPIAFQEVWTNNQTS